MFICLHLRPYLFYKGGASIENMRLRSSWGLKVDNLSLCRRVVIWLFLKKVCLGILRVDRKVC